MKVTPLAFTRLAEIPERILGTPFGERLVSDPASDLDLLGEVAGRACYESYTMPNPATAENEGYLANIIGQGHFSVLEHASVTFYVEGVSRSLTHELVRHRHLSFSELSQRYVDVEDATFVVPPALREYADGFVPKVADVVPDATEQYAEIVAMLVEKGLPRKKAREAARSVMPNATETRLVVTGNLRAWRDVLGKRWHVAADAEIREFAGLVLGHLRRIAPASVQDVPEEPYS